MSPKNSIPDRWLPYTPVGKQIFGTRFIAFKVPLKTIILSKIPEEDKRFGPSDLIKKIPKLRLIIDLTNTNRYYDPKEFTCQGYDHIKVACVGREMPEKAIVKKFFDVVDLFLSENPNEDTLIGVHCTHGVNRTGFMICKYMIERMDFSPDKAIQYFNEARGHSIERELFLTSLKNIDENSSVSIPDNIIVDNCYQSSNKTTGGFWRTYGSASSEYHSSGYKTYTWNKNQYRELNVDHYRSTKPKLQRNETVSQDKDYRTHRYIPTSAQSRHCPYSSSLKPKSKYYSNPNMTNNMNQY